MKIGNNFFLKIKFAVSLITSLATSSIFPLSASAQFKEQFTNSIKTTGQYTGHLDSSGNEIFFAGKDLPGVIGSIVGVALSMLGVFFLGLMIYSGYTWMVSRGNAQEVEKSKNTIINAVIGLMVVLMAYGLTIFISNTLK